MADYRAQRLARILADYERFTAHSNPMTDNNLIPPPELVQQWATASPVQSNDENWAYEMFIAHRAAQWGADQELEACCEWLIGWDTCEGERLASLLHEGRRPKPPSLKEQALETLQRLSKDKYPCNYQEDSDWDTIRRALEALPND